MELVKMAISAPRLAPLPLLTISVSPPTSHNSISPENPEEEEDEDVKVPFYARCQQRMAIRLQQITICAMLRHPFEESRHRGRLERTEANALALLLVEMHHGARKVSLPPPPRGHPRIRGGQEPFPYLQFVRGAILNTLENRSVGGCNNRKKVLTMVELADERIVKTLYDLLDLTVL